MRGIIFDLDGVICETDRYHYQAWKTIADELGVPFDEKVNDRLRGVSRMESLDIILERADRTYSPAEKEALAARKNALYRQLLAGMTPAEVSDEARRALETLRGRGVKLAIGSSSKNAKLILKQIGLEGYFDAVSDGTNIKRSKPDPEVFLKAAGMLGLPPAECLVVEDAVAGIDAAIAGGFMSAGLGAAAGHPGVTWRLEGLPSLLELK